MHDGPSHAPERRPSPGSTGGRRPLLNPDPIEHLTDLFLGDLGSPTFLPDPDDLPLPPLKADVDARRRVEVAARPTPTHNPTPVEPRLDAPLHAPRSAPPAPQPIVHTASHAAPTPALTPAPTTSPANHAAARTSAPTLRFSDLSNTPTHNPPPQQAAPRHASVEVVIVGHLPVAASPWVHQYARHRQRLLREPLSLLRWRGASVSVDLLGEPAQLPLPSCSSPAQAIAAAARLTHICQVSVDETFELDAATLAGVDRVTVLSGAHDTALVACYRALKGLTQHESIREGRCALHVVIMGGPDDRAKAAASRLERTTAAFLAHPIPCEIVPDKISPSRSTTLFTGPCPDSPLVALRPLLARPAVEAAHDAAPPTSAQDTTPPLPPLAPRLPGLRPVEIRCPFAPSVELAVSETGDLHVLAQASAAPDVPRAVADLTVASAWVRTNTDAIRKAIPELAARTGALAPSEHLVTAEPRAVRGLLDSRLKLHAQAGETLLDLN